MCRVTFEVVGEVSVEGSIDANRSLVQINGKLSTSGGTDAAIARSIGLRNIINAVGSEEVLRNTTVDELAEHILDSGLYDQLMARLMGVSEAA